MRELFAGTWQKRHPVKKQNPEPHRFTYAPRELVWVLTDERKGQWEEARIVSSWLDAPIQGRYEGKRGTLVEFYSLVTIVRGKRIAKVAIERIVKWRESAPV